MENLEEIGTIKVCQLACLLKSECEYFVYDTGLKDCQLLSAQDRKCDLLRGPPEPAYGELDCEGSTPATTEPPTDPPIDDLLIL